MDAIAFASVSKTFPMNAQRLLARGYLSRLLKRAEKQRFVALRNITFRIPPGQTVGVVGSNGAGKSTLLSLVAGLCPPDEGTVTVHGRVAPLLQLGAGFHPDLTGAENLQLNAALLGFSAKKTAESYERIVEFAGIGPFIDQPLRTYSSGMSMRLAFSIAIHVEPDILIIDEVLAVGDAAFQTKAFGRIKEMATAGAPVVLVSHQLDRIAELCTKAILLDHGAVRTSGTPMECINEYLHGATADAAGGSGHAGIRFDRIFAPNGSAVYSGENLTVIVEGSADLVNASPTWSPAVAIVDLRTGAHVHSVTGLQREVPMPVQGDFKYRLTFQMNVAPGAYDVDVHIWDSVLHNRPVQGIRLRVEVLERMPFYGATQLNSRWEVQKAAVPDISPTKNSGRWEIA